MNFAGLFGDHAHAEPLDEVAEPGLGVGHVACAMPAAAEFSLEHKLCRFGEGAAKERGQPHGRLAVGSWGGARRAHPAIPGQLPCRPSFYQDSVGAASSRIPNSPRNTSRNP